MEQWRKIRAALTVLLGSLAFWPSLTYAQLTPDDGKCAMGIFRAYSGHEFSHDLAAIAVGERPWRPGALWGDKWMDTQKHFKTIAMGGLVGQIWAAAVEAGFSYDTYSRCVAHGNTLMSYYYALRAKRLAGDPENYAAHAGDYSAFNIDDRKKITATTIGAASFLEMAADSIAADEKWRREHSSFFDFHALMGLP